MDNSAGVSTSDHEVNIKILLADAEAEGVLTRRARDELLEAMTEEVAELVLHDNALQSVALSLEQRDGAAALPAQAALMARLEAEGLLDRAVAGLPDATTLANRIAARDALTRPEIAALMPFAKLWLNDIASAGPLPEDPAFAPLLEAYFPTALQAEPYARFIPRHRLRRELVATALANRTVNRLGCAALARLTAEAEPARILAGAWLASELLGIEGRFEAAEAMAPEPRLTTQGALRALLEAATVEVLPSLDDGLRNALEELRPGIARLTSGPDGEIALEAYVANAPRLAAAPSVVRLARSAGVDPVEAARAWDAVGTRYQLDALREAARQAPLTGPFADRARATLLNALRATHARLAAARLAGQEVDDAAARALAEEAARFPDFAGASVAARALAMLAA
jgi:glutamate dehydrogenase